MLIAHAAVSLHDGSMASKAAPGSFVDFYTVSRSKEDASDKKMGTIIPS
jgi:hypothetical protein